MRLVPLLLLLAVLTPAAPAAAAPTWLPPSFLTEEAASAPVSALAVAPDGTAVAAWSRDTGGGGRTVEVARRPPGGAFAVVCSPATGGQNGLTPQVAMDAAGTATVAWAEQPAGTIRATRLPAGAAGCEPAETVSTGAGNTQPALDVGTGGTAVLVFEAPFGGQRQQYAAIREGAAGEFGAPAPISVERGEFESAVDGSSTVDVAVDPAGNAAVAWAARLSAVPERHQVEVTHRSAGAPFPPSGVAPTTVSPTGTQTRPSITIDPAGRTTAAWAYDPDATGGGELSRVQYADREPGGAFSLGQTASQPGEAAETPAVEAAADGTVIGAWSFGTADNRRIQTAIRQPGGGFGQFGIVSPAGGEPIRPVIAVNAKGDAMVAWGRNDFAGVFSSFKPAGGVFGATQTLGERGSPPPGQSFDFFDPRVGLDDEGNAAAVLTHNHFRAFTEHYRVQTASYDAAPPTLTASVPAGGVAGQPIGMAAAATDRLSAVSLSWSLGDGVTATGGAVQHAFGAAGAFTVTVTATDAVGNAATTSAPVLVAAPPRPPRVDAGVSVKWALQGKFTYLIGMRVRRPPAGAKVSLRCTGKKCPFKRRSFGRVRRNAITLLATKKARKVVKLKSRRFRKGQRLEVRITAPGQIGKVVRYTVRRGDIPSTRTLCLPLGAARPRAAC